MSSEENEVTRQYTVKDIANAKILADHVVTKRKNDNGFKEIERKKASEFIASGPTPRIINVHPPKTSFEIDEETNQNPAIGKLTDTVKIARKLGKRRTNDDKEKYDSNLFLNEFFDSANMTGSEAMDEKSKNKTSVKRIANTAKIVKRLGKSKKKDQGIELNKPNSDILMYADENDSNMISKTRPTIQNVSNAIKFTQKIGKNMNIVNNDTEDESFDNSTKRKPNIKSLAKSVAIAKNMVKSRPEENIFEDDDNVDWKTQNLRNLANTVSLGKKLAKKKHASGRNKGRENQTMEGITNTLSLAKKLQKKKRTHDENTTLNYDNRNDDSWEKNSFLDDQTLQIYDLNQNPPNQQQKLSTKTAGMSNEGESSKIDENDKVLLAWTMYSSLVEMIHTRTLLQEAEQRLKESEDRYDNKIAIYNQIKRDRESDDRQRKVNNCWQDDFIRINEEYKKQKSEPKYGRFGPVQIEAVVTDSSADESTDCKPLKHDDNLPFWKRVKPPFPSSSIENKKPGSKTQKRLKKEKPRKSVRINFPNGCSLDGNKDGVFNVPLRENNDNLDPNHKYYICYGTQNITSIDGNIIAGNRTKKPTGMFHSLRKILNK